jgi:hypothetical protein
MTTTFAQGVIAPVAGQHRGDDIRHPDFRHPRVLDIAGGNMLVGRGVRVAEVGHVEGAVDQQGAGDGDHPEGEQRFVAGLLFVAFDQFQ